MQCVQEIKPPNITQLSEKYGTKIKQYEPVTSALPDTVDWRTAGAVTHVKDQVCHCISHLYLVMYKGYRLSTVTIGKSLRTA